MKKSLSLLLILSVFILSCDKIKKTEKEMEGTWAIYSVKTTETTGLSYYNYNAGTITYSDFNDGNGLYSMDLTFKTSSGLVTKHESGTISLKGDGEFYDLVRNNSDGTTTSIIDARIILITKNDIKCYYQVDNMNFLMILEK